MSTTRTFSKRDWAAIDGVYVPEPRPVEPKPAQAASAALGEPKPDKPDKVPPRKRKG